MSSVQPDKVGPLIDDQGFQAEDLQPSLIVPLKVVEDARHSHNKG